MEEQAAADAVVPTRRLGAALGIRAPSLYKHGPDKAAVEAALIAIALRDFGAAYRAYALDHPQLYRPMTDRPLPRESRPPGVEDAAAAPLLQVRHGDLAWCCVATTGVCRR